MPVTHGTSLVHVPGMFERTPVYCNHQEQANTAEFLVFLLSIFNYLLQPNKLYWPSSDGNDNCCRNYSASLHRLTNDFGQNMKGLLKYIAEKHRMAIVI